MGDDDRPEEEAEEPGLVCRFEICSLSDAEFHSTVEHVHARARPFLLRFSVPNASRAGAGKAARNSSSFGIDAPHPMAEVTAPCAIQSKLRITCRITCMHDLRFVLSRRRGSAYDTLYIRR